MNSFAAAAAILALGAVSTPALACLPMPVTDGIIAEGAARGGAAIGRVTSVRTISHAQCLRIARAMPPGPGPGPNTDNCNGSIGTAEIRIERVLAGQASGPQHVAWGETLQCRASFTPRVGDRVVVFTGPPRSNRMFGRMTGWALPESQARGSPILAAAFDAQP